MTQTNVNTGYVRKVMYKEVNSATMGSVNVQWYYRDDKKMFAA